MGAWLAVQAYLSCRKDNPTIEVPYLEALVVESEHGLPARWKREDLTVAVGATYDGGVVSFRSWNQSGIARFSRLIGGRIAGTNLGPRRAEIQSLV